VEDGGSDWIKSGLDGGRVFEYMNVVHKPKLDLDNKNCQGLFALTVMWRVVVVPARDRGGVVHPAAGVGSPALAGAGEGPYLPWPDQVLRAKVSA